MLICQQQEVTLEGRRGKKNSFKVIHVKKGWRLERNWCANNSLNILMAFGLRALG